MKTKTIRLGEREVEIRKLSIRKLRDFAERAKAIPDDATQEHYVVWIDVICASIDAAGGSVNRDDLFDLDLEDVMLAYADVKEWSHIVEKRPGEAKRNP